MKNIREFKLLEEFNEYVNSNIKYSIGNSSEGSVYLTKNDNVLKDISNIYYPMYLEKNKDVIMSDDLKLDSFIFPDELYVFEDKIIGYIAEYFKCDIFENFISDIDVDALVSARKKFIEDMKVLTDKGYFLFDMGFNTLFDNHKLCAIDTLDYYKKDGVTLEENLNMLDYALITRLRDHNVCNRNTNSDADFDTVIAKIKKKSR